MMPLRIKLFDYGLDETLGQHFLELVHWEILKMPLLMGSKMEVESPEMELVTIVFDLVLIVAGLLISFISTGLLTMLRSGVSLVSGTVDTITGSDFEKLILERLVFRLSF